MIVTAIRNEPVLEATMQALILYDDCDSAARANAMLEDAARHMGEGAHWKVMPWRTTLLNSSPAADMALREASEAHLIVFALHAAGHLPAWLMDWLETWAARRLVQEAGLAVFGGENGDGLSSPRTAELCQFAQRHGLSLIFDDGEPVADESSIFARDLHERAMSLTPTIQSILHQPIHGYHRGWGINE
jgi:hypothetical protein